jgi:hypothetical protein
MAFPLPSFARATNVERKIDRSLHPLLLRRPCSAENRVWRRGGVFDGARFHLSEKAAEVTNQISAFEIRWETLESLAPLAPWAWAGLGDQLFSDLARNLLFGRQRFPGRPKSLNWIRSGRRSVVNDSTGRSYHQRLGKMLYDSASVTNVNAAAHIKTSRKRWR